MATNKYSNTTTANLWDAMEQATGKPVKKLAASWTEQPGFPLIKMTSQCVNGNRVINLEQVPFIVGDPDPRPLQWTIPVGILSTAKPDEPKYALLDKLSNNFDFPGCSGVLKGNPNGIGFFRIEYEPALFDDLQKNINQFSEADRVNFTTDTWAMVESGHEAAAYFNLLEKLRADDSYAVWESTLGTDRTTVHFALLIVCNTGNRAERIISATSAPCLLRNWLKSAGKKNRARATKCYSFGFC
jgi:aminopeptidase N